MKKPRHDNPRYPHTVKIVRTVVSDNPFEDMEERRVLYEGVCRSYTDTTTTGDKVMDTNKRKLSIPVRFDMWAEPILDGDAVEVSVGEIVETGTVRDMEADNCRTVIYWEYRRV